MPKSKVKADPSKWSKQSKQSYSFESTKEYEDIGYLCWRCKKPDVFTAVDQQHSFEVKKNYFWQRRVLCQSCWMESNKIKEALEACQAQWLELKSTLQNDIAFLSRWLELLIELEEYVGYRPDTAKKNMLKKLLKIDA